MLYIAGVKKERVAETRVSLLLMLAEFVLSGRFPCGEIKVLEKHLEFHPVVSCLGSKDASEGRGCGSEGLRLRGAHPAQDVVCWDSVVCVVGERTGSGALCSPQA